MELTVEHLSFRTCFSFPVQHHEIHRNDQHRYEKRGEQSYRDAHRLVVKQGTGDAAQENQRDKHRTGGQHRTQHRGEHLVRSFHEGIRKRHPLPPPLHHVIDNDDGVVHNHSHTENQSRQGDDVQRDV